MSKPKEIPFEAGMPFFGHLFSYQKNRLKLLEDFAKRHGDIFKIKIGPKTLVVLNHPDFIQHVLQKNFANYIRKSNIDKLFGRSIVTTNGNEWKSLSTVIRPLFNKKNILPLRASMQSITNNFLKTVSYESKNMPDIRDLFSEISFKIIVKVTLGEVCEKYFKTIDQSLNYITHHLTKETYKVIALPEKLSLANRKFKQSISNLNNALYEIIHNFSKNQNEQSLLSVLLKEIKGEESEDLTSEDLTKLVKNNLLSVLFAGYETSAMVLSNCASELAKNKAYQERAAKNDLFLEACLYETMRLYPPGWAFTRFALESDQIDNYAIASGDYVLCSPYLTQRDSRFWYRPKEFLPERFLDQQKIKNFPSYLFFPFGAGLRVCPGQFLAMVEMKVIMKSILNQNVFCSHGPKPQIDARLTLFSKNGHSINIIPKEYSKYKIVFVDGPCNLCHFLSKLILSWDVSKEIRVASLQGECAKVFFKNLSPKDIKSVIYLDHGKFFYKSDAVVHIAKNLKYPMKLLSLIRILPIRVRNLAYELIAKNRYHLFGKHKDICQFRKDLDPSRVLP